MAGEGGGESARPVGDAVGLRAVALAFAVAFPFSLLSARSGVVVFVTVLGASALWTARRRAEATPPPPPIPLRRDRRARRGPPAGPTS